MLKPVVVLFCLALSYFVVFWMLTGYWGKALMTGIVASLLFSTTLLAASFVAKGRPWRAFWIANAVLILIFGGAEFYGMLTQNSQATRFDGARLTINGDITAAGFASLALDITVCTVSNFLGFYLSRILIKRFEVDQRA
jgi:hypothetical protein